MREIRIAAAAYPIDWQADLAAYAAKITAWVEEAGIFVNTEGRPQMANRAGFPPGDARENWAILRALSAQLGRALPYDSLAALRRARGG